MLLQTFIMEVAYGLSEHPAVSNQPTDTLACGSFVLWNFIYDINASVIDPYREKRADCGYERTNRYYVLGTAWHKNQLFNFLLWKSEAFYRYPDDDNGVDYYEYRQMQTTLICRALAFVSFFLDTILFICDSYFIGLPLFVWAISSTGTIKNVLTRPIMKRDVKRLKSYQYPVANSTEPIATDARKKPPALWKINTLLDVFFYFGQAPIRYCKTQNYLVYRLKGGKLLYVFLKDSFKAMPEEELPLNSESRPKRTIWHYNPAMTVWVDECICVDSTNPSALSGKDILPQDMPEVLLSKHS